MIGIECLWVSIIFVRIRCCGEVFEASGCDDVGRRDARANWMEEDVERVVEKKGREEDGGSAIRGGVC